MISPTLHSQDIVKQRLKDKKPVYNFGLGENPFKPPHQLVECITKHIDKKHYTPASGIPELHSIIKHQYSNSNYTADHVFFGNGLKELIFVLQAVFDGIIIHITPSWVSYKEQIFILNKTSKNIFIKTTFSNQFRLDCEYLNDVLSHYKKKKKLIIFNNPNNPTGICYTSSRVSKIAKILKMHNCIVFADEIYQNIVYENTFKSISNYLPDLTIRGSSISKDLACGGYRLGWMTFPKSLWELYRHCLCYASSMYSCPTTCIQYGLAEYLTHHEEDYIAYRKNSIMIFNKISKCICDKLRESQIEFNDNNSSWYLFLNFKKYGEKLNKIGIHNGIDLTEYLINTYGIVMVAGEYFSYDGIVTRMSLVDIDDIDNIDVNNIEKNCSKMINGISVLLHFLNQL